MSNRTTTLDTKQFRDGTKRQQARQLYLQLKATHTRNEIIAEFFGILGMDLPGCSSYYEQVKDPDGAKKEESKMDQARRIYNENLGAARNIVLKKFEEQIVPPLSKGGLSRYYQTVKTEQKKVIENAG